MPRPLVQRPPLFLPLLLDGRCHSAGAASSRPSVLWAPGEQANEDQTDRLAGKIGMLCRDGQGLCVVGSRGEVPTARAMRALAKASEWSKSPVEFRVRWHEDPENARSLRFYSEIRYSYTDFKRKWRSWPEPPRKLAVTPDSVVHKVATALCIEERKNGCAVLKLNPQNNKVMAIAAKCLATLPHLSQIPQKGSDMVCVLRWPQSAGAKWVYAHVWRLPVVAAEGEQDQGESDLDSWGKKVIA